MPKQPRSRALVQALLDATDAIAQERGVASLTMPLVIRRAGVGGASVYEYFPTKTALLAAWAERVWERAMNAAFTATHDSLVVERLPKEQGVPRIVHALNGVLRPYARACRGAGLDMFVGRVSLLKETVDTLCVMIQGAMVGGGTVADVRVTDMAIASRLLATIFVSNSYLRLLASEADEQALDNEVSALLIRYLRGDP